MHFWIEPCVLVYMSFRARQHQRSLATVMNDFWWLWWSMISGDERGLHFPDIVLRLWKNTGKKSQPGKLTWPGSNQGPLGERQRCYPPTTAVFSSIRAICPPHFSRLDLRFLIMSVEEYNACSSALCNFLHSPVFLSTLFPNSLNLCSSIKVRNQVWESYNW